MAGDYRAIAVGGDGLAAYLRALARTRGNGSTYVRRFGWSGDPEGWMATLSHLARRAEHDLLEDRYEDVDVYYSDAPWSPWFFDVAWDQTWILVDRRRHQVTVICSTDTD